MSDSNYKFAYGKNSHSLTISNFNDNSNDNYTCLAVNDNWILRSATANVRKSFLTALYDDTNIIDITVQPNSELLVPCNPDYIGYPLNEIDFEWKALASGGSPTDDDNYIKSGGEAENLFRVSCNGTLVIPRVTMEEFYQCTISVGKEDIFYRVHILVDGSEITDNNIPHVIIPPTNVIGNEGDSIVFDCIPGGSDVFAPLISWSVPNDFDNIDELEGKTELNVNSISQQDEGEYSCEVTGISDTHTASLIVRDPPVLTAIPPSSVNITYGESQSLTCIVTGDDVYLVWYHNGLMISYNNTITINNADLSHGGVYQCFAIGPTKSVTNATLVTINTIAPLLLPNGTLHDQIAFRGKDLTLSCEATGAPEPSYMWLRDGTNAIDLITLGIDLSTPGSLKIPSVVENFEGMYTCIATSELNGKPVGNDTSSAMVIITDPTEFMSINPATITSYIGDPFHLNCTVLHDKEDTTVTLQWILNGNVITNTILSTQPGKKTLLLNVTSASLSHQGVYQCIAVTEYIHNNDYEVPTVESSLTMVTITDAPIEPTITLVSAVSPSVLEVSWTYKGFLSNLKEYQIEYQEYNSGVEWFNNGVHPKSGTTVINITGLKPYTQYNVRVIAILNNNQEEQVISAIYGPTRTSEDVPVTAPPSNRVFVSVNTSSTTRVLVEWEAPSQPNGIITDYTIRYWYNDTRQNSITTDVLVGGNSTRYILTELIPDTAYLLQIAAHTAAGIGPFSEAVNVSTIPTIGNVSEMGGQFYTKIWFILICATIVLLLIVITSTLVAILRWRHNNKGNMYTVRNNFFVEEISLSEDVVADYNRKRDRPMGMDFTESIDGSRPNLHDTQLDYPYFGRAESFRGSLRSSFRGSIKGLPPPPEYINPPSFEETLKSRLARNRSASTTLLEKVDHSNFRGSGWSVGHDPKSSFFLPSHQQHHLHHHTDPEVDSIVGGKPHFPEPGEETSGESDTSTGLHTQSATNVESFAQFV